jgi:hypothetical protein
MNLPKRLEVAINKLYSAFHNNELNPECCCKCAVGNILDNKDSWKNLTDRHGSMDLNYLGRVHQNLGRKFNGYSPLELLQMEAVFLKACGYAIPFGRFGNKPKSELTKDVLFQGLCAIVEFLCQIDDVKNVMDYSEIFDYHKYSSKIMSEPSPELVIH